MERRSFLGCCAGLGLLLSGGKSRADSPASSALRAIDLRVGGNARVARRAMVFVPTHVPAATPLPVLVLLHGLGETVDERLGIHAWGERYGLVRAHERLRNPPLERTLSHSRYLTDAHRDQLNQSLTARPYQGAILVCPFTPNPWKLDGASTIAAYADWLETTLLPAVRARTPTLPGRSNTAIDGCSLGGWVAIEVFLRKPALFGVLGVVQPAISVGGASGYATRIAQAANQHGATAVHVESSTGDPYRAPSEALSRELKRVGISNDLEVLPGPHDQPWLREVGTPTMLLWHDRKLRSP